MGVYIPNMDMPESLGVNLTIYPDGRVCKSDPYSGLKMVATAIELPDGHGRLIDADALKSNIVKKLGISDRRYLLPAENAIWEEINKAQTIIPAYKEET